MSPPRRKPFRSDLVFFLGGDSEKVLRESRNARMVCVFFGGGKRRGVSLRLTFGEVAR